MPRLGAWFGNRDQIGVVLSHRSVGVTVDQRIVVPSRSPGRIDGCFASRHRTSGFGVSRGSCRTGRANPASTGR